MIFIDHVKSEMTLSEMLSILDNDDQLYSNDAMSNIRISPEIKTSQEALRRAQVLVRIHNESSEDSQSEVMAAVQLKEDSHALIY